MNDSTLVSRTALEHYRGQAALLFASLVARPALAQVIGPHASLACLTAATLDPQARPEVVFDVEGLTFAVGLGRGLEVRLRHQDGRYSQPVCAHADLPAAMREAGFEPWDW